jgi:hypothetical protein
VGEWWDWGLGAESILLVVFIQLTPYSNPRIASYPQSLVPWSSLKLWLSHFTLTPVLYVLLEHCPGEHLHNWLSQYVHAKRPPTQCAGSSIAGGHFIFMLRRGFIKIKFSCCAHRDPLSWAPRALDRCVLLVDLVLLFCCRQWRLLEDRRHCNNAWFWNRQGKVSNKCSLDLGFRPLSCINWSRWLYGTSEWSIRLGSGATSILFNDVYTFVRLLTGFSILGASM